MLYPWNNKEKVSIWGTGSQAKKAYCNVCNDCDIYNFYDNDRKRWGEYIYGKKVRKYTNETKEKIIIASEWWRDISAQLMEEYELKIFEDFIPYEILNSRSINLENMLNLFEVEDVVRYIKILRRNKKIVTIFGNCQTFSISRIMEFSPDFNKEYIFMEIPKVYEYKNDENIRKILYNEYIWNLVDVFIYQKVSSTNKYSELLCTEKLLGWGGLRKDCLKICIVNMYFGGYFIQCAKGENDLFFDVFNVSLFNYKDKFVEKWLEMGFNLDEIISKVQDENLLGVDEVQKEIEICFEESEEREKEVDVKILDYIRENYKKKQLFYSHRHPCNELILEYTNRILKYMNLKEFKGSLNDVERICGNTKGQDVPIYPSVVKNLQLKEYEKGFFGNTGIGCFRYYNFEEIMREYIKYVCKEKEFIDLGLL